MTAAKTVFALDVGTRNVVGVVGRVENGELRVIGAETEEHAGRAVKAGQIRDIQAVAHAIALVKRRLEESVGEPLETATVAAAGRSLVTAKATSSGDVPAGMPVDDGFLLSLELAALRDASRQAVMRGEAASLESRQANGAADGASDGADAGWPNSDGSDADGAHKAGMQATAAAHGVECVGYAVTGYKADGYPLPCPVGHKCGKVEASIIAAYLPSPVIGGLRAAMRLAGIGVAGMTLEPAAALGAMAPSDAPALDIALVDVGAGTSDIAVVCGGEIAAFAMADVAGDEITDRICKEFLVDFGVGESIKAELSRMAGGFSGDSVSFADLLGNRRVIGAEEAIAAISPAVDDLAARVAERLAACVAESGCRYPAAVMLVGGGSQTAGLAESLAAAMGMPPERVKVMDRSFVRGVTHGNDGLMGPECATPLGIAAFAAGSGRMSALAGSAAGGCVSVMADGRAVRLIGLHEPKAMDALAYAGVQPERLIGREGKAVRYWRNGVAAMALGSSGTPAAVFVNGARSSLDAELKLGDEVTITDAQDGIDACPKIRDAAVAEGYDRPETPWLATRNGEPAGPGDAIMDGDEISVHENAGAREAEPGAGVREAEPGAGADGANVPGDATANAATTGDGLTGDGLRWISLTLNELPAKALAGADGAIFADALHWAAEAGVLPAPSGAIRLRANGAAARLTDQVRQGDRLEIRCS